LAHQNRYRYVFIPVVAAIALAGCTQHLDEQDRALLTETRDMAQQAKTAADAADQDAKAAQAAADKAEADVQTMSVKTERMYQSSQNK